MRGRSRLAKLFLAFQDNTKLQNGAFLKEPFEILVSSILRSEKGRYVGQGDGQTREIIEESSLGG